MTQKEEISKLKKKLKVEYKNAKTSEDGVRVMKKVNVAIKKYGGNWAGVYKN